MDKKVVILGAGVSGLSAGIYALQAGYSVEIYEKNKVPGGECTGWNSKDIISIIVSIFLLDAIEMNNYTKCGKI